MAAASGASPKSVPPTFVELVARRGQSIPECAIELEGRHRKMRLQLRGTSTADLAMLSRILWEMAS
jgi:hypothetical protein